MEDKNIKKMATLLRSGATMLDKNCPKCNYILFRLKNNSIYCPICDREVIIVKNEMDEKKITKTKGIEKKLSTGMMAFEDLNNIFSDLISDLSIKIQKTEDLYVIEKILSNIDKSLNIIKKLRELR